MTRELDRETLDFDTGGLDFAKGGGSVPVVAQHYLTGEVLMLGYATPEALDITVRTAELTFHSRSRDALWTKGETSGNVLRVVSIHADCDGDTLLARVDPAGPTCHTGRWSCFEDAAPTLPALAATLEARLGADPGSSYTARLLSDRNLRLKKLGEEAAELAVACADEDTERVRDEAADVVYHTLVAALAAGVSVQQVLEALDERRG
jgi:phosphoribosyl-ATP pyrophosphohydrolase/phosphoribosyl-AMP cyclohydrolase